MATTHAMFYDALTAFLSASDTVGIYRVGATYYTAPWDEIAAAFPAQTMTVTVTDALTAGGLSASEAASIVPRIPYEWRDLVAETPTLDDVLAASNPSALEGKTLAVSGGRVVGQAHSDTTLTEAFAAEGIAAQAGKYVKVGPAGVPSYDNPAGSGGSDPPPVTLTDTAGKATLTADKDIAAFWATFDGSAVVTLSDGTNTITGTIANGTSDATHIDVGGGMNNANESALQAFVVWLMINYRAGNIDVRPIYEFLYPYVEFGQTKMRTGETLYLTTRTGAGVAAITLTLPPACAGALTLTLPV